jgi:hypothetical protein
MLPGPTSFELPDWKEPLSVTRADRPEWFERLVGANGDGVALPSPVPLRPRPAEPWGDN